MAQGVNVKITIRGAKELKNALDRFPKQAASRFADAINKAIIKIEQTTFPLTPRKTGKLRAQYPIDRRTATPSSLRGAVRNTTPYAVGVHNLYSAGTPYRRPTTPGTVAGFLIVGANRAQGEVDKIFVQALEDITEDLGK